MKRILRKIKKYYSLIKKAVNYQGSIKRKLKFLYFEILALRNGVTFFRVERVADLYTKDYFDFQDTSKDDKEWAYSHGFSSYKMLPWYGITMDNYKDYISDFDFYSAKNYIQNNDILAWFENKLNTYYLLSPFRESMPRHYWSVMNGRFFPIDVEDEKIGECSDVMKTIREQGPIAAKACYGGHGVGFLKFDYKDKTYFVNNMECKEDEIKERILSLNNYIITDYVKPNSVFEKLCGTNSFAVMRIITVFDDFDGPQITCSAIRLGCKKAGITTDHEGTIYCGIGIENGVSFKPLYRVADNKYVSCPLHPDTNEPLEGFKIPNYDKLKVLVKKISAYLPMTPYLVMDIIPTEKGFAILEINSHGQVGNVEPFYPFLANKYNKKVFHIQ